MSAIALPEAFEELLEPKRYKVYYGGRGGAKSHAYARALLWLGMEKPLRIVCAREIQKSIKDSVHQLLSDVIHAHDLTNFYTVLNDRIRGANGTSFSFIGLKHNPAEIKSLEGVDVIWVEEAENVSHNSWEIVIPTIRKEGSEIWVTFNPKNPSDPTYVRFVKNATDSMLVRKVSWRDNPFFPKTLDDERKKLERTDPEAYRHIWEGEFDLRRSGAVYAKQIQRAREEERITRVPYDPATEVFTAWDLGFGDSTAIWWLQFIGRELRWLEYYEASGEQLGHYVRVIKEKNYNYRDVPVYLPHDGGHGNIRGDSVSNQLREAGLPNVVLTRETDITPGIELLRQTIAYSVFDYEKCKDGIHCLENYGYEYDDTRQVFKKSPRHDWTSHAADAARYAARAAQQMKEGHYEPVSMKIGNRGSWMGL